MTNNSTNSAEDILAFPAPQAAVIGFFICLCIILTVFGNSVVLLAFVKEKYLRNFSDYLILNLAVSDLIIGSISIPFYTPYVLTKKWPFGHTFCLIWLIVDYITPAASALNIGVISLDRYLQVAHPLWARKHRSPLLLAIFLITPWALPAIYFVPAISLWEVTHGRVIPDQQCHLPYNSNITVLLIGAIIEFLTPFVTVLILNLLVYICIRHRSKRFLNSVRGNESPQLNEHHPEHTAHDIQVYTNNLNVPSHENTVTTNSRMITKSKINKDRKAARSLFIFVLVFAICWMPYEILATASTICGVGCIDSVLYEFTFWILWVNSTINPVLYPVLHSRYRRAFATLFTVKHNRILPVGPITQS